MTLHSTLPSSLFLTLALALAACPAPAPEGLRRTDPGTGAEVKFDVFVKPLPDIPLPNDFATRYDPDSPTRRRINASMVAPTAWERAVRSDMATLDGWGTFSAISVGFTEPLDVEVIFERHRDDFAFFNDAVYLIDISPDSPDFCQPQPLDMGAGNFPLTLERTTYYPNDPRNHTNNLLFEEVDEDVNGNGRLDPGEDTDMDGVLDKPNLRFPDGDPVDDLLTFYERETNTLQMRPLMPLRENTTYAVVLTRRLLDHSGRPVRSPFDFINHTAQTDQLRPLPGCLGKVGLTLDDVAFTWPYTTQSITRDIVAIRDGMYGHGPMAWLADEYPAVVSQMHRIRKEGADNPYIVPGDHFLSAASSVIPLIGGDNPQMNKVIESHQFIGFHAVGSFEAPQFFPRHDEDGNLLPLHQQVWRVNPTTGEAFHRKETVTFWLTMPHKTIARRPVPVVILGHGYTGNKLDPLIYGGHFARHGIATIGMECVSHGIELPDVDKQLARGVFAGNDLELMFDAIMRDRAFDHDGDGTKDSGADFWTAYAFHTRDVVRQSAVDYLRMIQILKSFDGKRTWMLGTKEGIAGDFDGDGEVDVGGTGSISISGGSLGGIMSTVVGGAEPFVDTALPIAGGGGLPDVGIRSIQGGVAEAVNLRMMGPLLLGLRSEAGALELWQYLPDRNKVGRANFGPLDDARMREGDTVVAHNLRSLEHRCARVQADGLFRVAVSSDEGDPLELRFYEGALPPEERSGCHVPEGTEAYLTVSTLNADVTFQSKDYAKGSPLVALGDGFGLRRNSAETRRFHGLAQMILDPADPVNWAPFFENRLLRYEAGGEVRTRALVINTIGDMNVPMSTGAAISRAAGFVPYQTRDPRWNKTPNQVLIDTGALEAVERLRRHVNAQGNGVLMDLEQLAELNGGVDGHDAPRLHPPLRLWGPSTRVGGITGTLFPFVTPTGRHGFDPPDPSATFDLGAVMANMLGRYVASRGTELPFEACMHDFSCDWILPVPDPQAP